MKALRTVTAVLEAGTGVALLACPSGVVMLLLGTPLDSANAFALGRVAGAALLALGVACWMARSDGQSSAAMGLVLAMLIYNGAVAGILAFAGIKSGLAGIALWPAVILHTGMAAWCAVNLKNNFRK
jgi:hypothetical protein